MKISPALKNGSKALELQLYLPFSGGGDDWSQAGRSRVGQAAAVVDQAAAVVGQAADEAEAEQVGREAFLWWICTTYICGERPLVLSKWEQLSGHLEFHWPGMGGGGV
jgi:hypothetical protein